jgi:hypothetical protein
MTAEEAKTAISGFAAANRIRFSSHARARMTQRSITYQDIRSTLVTSTACVAGSDADRWVVTGVDLDGEETEVVCAVEEGVVVITVF